MRRLATFALLATFAVGAAACGSSTDDTTSTGDTPGESTTQSSTTASTGPTTGGLQLTVTESGLGEIVVDAEGRTLYLFTSDSGSESTCYGSCESVWPPLVGDVTAGPGVTGELGTTTRTDGSTQVTLGGHPLYHYAADVDPGDTSGQGVDGVWFVVDGAGDAIEDDASSGAGGY